MRKVIGIGETVLDIIFKNEQPVEAVPGGSTFNAITSLARAGAETMLISETGTDLVGDRIVKFLRDNGVCPDYMRRSADIASPLSLAFLNERNEANYVFYTAQSRDQVDMTLPEINPDDIILLGSYYAVNPKVRPQVQALLEQAQRQGAIIYYDVNFRPNHRSEVIRITPNLLENLGYADIVRGSRDDFMTLYKMDDADRVYKAEIAFYCRQFIYTDGANPVELRADGGMRRSYPVGKVDTVSTIGAGDSFNAGFIYGLLRERITRQQLIDGLSTSQWDSLVDYALRFSAECCKGIFNYVSKDFGAAISLKGGE